MKSIIEAVDRFINNRMYHYALLINGKWGCGKTYYVQTELIPHIKKNVLKDVNYLSLYGVRSTDEISKILCVQAIKDKMGKVGKASDTKGGQFARENGKLIIIITVNDLKKMYELKVDQSDPSEVLLDRLDKMLEELEK